MTPVLATHDPAAACRMLADQFGFMQVSPGLMTFGTAMVAVVPATALPENLIALPVDHVAFAVDDADAVYRRFSAAGGQIDPAFTPGGPRDIAQFWDHGVRFVFFAGPEGAAFEFCAKNRVKGPVDVGHSHFGIRSANLDLTQADLARFGAKLIARHLLPAAPYPVDVRFVQAGPDVFELFDEAPAASPKPGLGWVGFLPDAP